MRGRAYAYIHCLRLGISRNQEFRPGNNIDLGNTDVALIDWIERRDNRFFRVIESPYVIKLTTYRTQGGRASLAQSTEGGFSQCRVFNHIFSGHDRPTVWTQLASVVCDAMPTRPQKRIDAVPLDADSDDYSGWQSKLSGFHSISRSHCFKT